MRLSLLLLPLWATGAAAESWTAAHAVAAALRHHPDAAIAAARIDAAAALVTQAEAVGRPQVALSGRYTQTDSPALAFGAVLGQRAFRPGLDFNAPGQVDNLGLAATVDYTLYAGGRDTANRAAAMAGARAADAEAATIRHRLATEALKALLHLRKARAAVDAVAGGVRAYEAAVANARWRFDAGQMLKADLLGLEVTLAETRERLTAARHAAALAERAFLVVLGQAPTPAGSVALAASDPMLEALAAPTDADPAARPELALLRARMEAAERRLAAARAGGRPTVNAFAAVQHDRGWRLDRHGDSWLAGVAVDLNVFDGGRRAGVFRQAQAELAEARETLRRAELGYALEAEQARLAHAAALERLAVSAQAVAQAEEGAALSRARFEQGALLAADLIASESRLLDARLRRAVATADERIALAELHRALGRTPLLSP